MADISKPFQLYVLWNILSRLSLAEEFFCGQKFGRLCEFVMHEAKNWTTNDF